MEGHASLQEVRVEIAGVVKQIGRVEFNSNAVEAAIAGKGTYRGYSGEDVFLKSNLRVVQREMMKQLRRRERSLTHRKRKLEANLGLAALATQTPQPAAAAVGEAPNGGGAASPLPRPEPPRRGSPSPGKTIAALSKSAPTRLPAVIVPAEVSDRSRRRRPESSLPAPEPTPPPQVASTALAAGAQPKPAQSSTEQTPPTATLTVPPTPAGVPTSASATPSEATAAPADQNLKPAIDTQGMVEIMAQQAFVKYAATAKPFTGTTFVRSRRNKSKGVACAAVVPMLSPTGKDAAAAASISEGGPKSSGSSNVAIGPNSGGGGRDGGGGNPASKTDRSKSALSAAAGGGESASSSVNLRKRPDKRKDLNAAPAPRSVKSSRRGASVPGPAHSVQEYLANTQRGTEAVASVRRGTVFWIKFSDTKEAWLECGVVKKVHQRSAVPYEVEWRPFDSTGCHLALNPKKRIALTPRLYVTSSDGAKEKEKRAAAPPAGTKDRDGFELCTKGLMLNVPPIGSWCIVKPSQPWGELGPFAF